MTSNDRDVFQSRQASTLKQYSVLEERCWAKGKERMALSEKVMEEKQACAEVLEPENEEAVRR
eukprot:5166829-Lingulodinium_polyedra.AAC.1